MKTRVLQDEPEEPTPAGETVEATADEPRRSRNPPPWIGRWSPRHWLAGVRGGAPAKAGRSRQTLSPERAARRDEAAPPPERRNTMESSDHNARRPWGRRTKLVAA